MEDAADDCGSTSKRKSLLNPSFKGSRRFATEDPRVVGAFESLEIGSKADKDEKNPGKKLIRWPTGFHPSHATVADLSDLFLGNCGDLDMNTGPVKVLNHGLRDFGGLASFSGKATTIKCFENNPIILKTLREDGHGRVLVVDGGGSMRCALIGDLLAELGAERGWSGIIINGCVRDVAEICNFNIGIKALAAHPIKPGKRQDHGQIDVPIVVCGVTINPGDWIYADPDGVIASSVELKVPEGRPAEKVPLYQ